MEANMTTGMDSVRGGAGGGSVGGALPRELIAILGGVLGFWGGVWCLGILFLASLLLQRSVKGVDGQKVQIFSSNLYF